MIALEQRSRLSLVPRIDSDARGGRVLDALVGVVVFTWHCWVMRRERWVVPLTGRLDGGLLKSCARFTMRSAFCASLGTQTAALSARTRAEIGRLTTSGCGYDLALWRKTTAASRKGGAMQARIKNATRATGPRATPISSSTGSAITATIITSTVVTEINSPSHIAEVRT